MKRPILEPEYKRFGAVIKRYRKISGLSQTELGKRVGLSKPSIGNIEIGNRRFNFHMALRIISELDISLSEIMDREIEDQRDFEEFNEGV